MIDSRFTLTFRAVVLVLALAAVTLGLLAGQHAAQFVEGRTANFSQVLLAEGR